MELVSPRSARLEMLAFKARTGAAAALLLAALAPASSGGSTPSGPIEMEIIANLPVAAGFPLAGPNGWDFDHDSKREFVETKGGKVRFHEALGNDSFALVHQIEITPPPWQYGVSLLPSAVGDADGDGLKELILYGMIGSQYFVRVYESASLTTYPIQLAWELEVPSWEKAAKIADTDGDGIQEIVVAGGDNPNIRIAVYENTGDDAYTQTAYIGLPQLNTPQSMTVADDLDGDGRPEILVGGLSSSGGQVFAVEAQGNDDYVQSWSVVLPAGETVNVTSLADGGDLDGDGRKEFLAGGFRPEFPGEQTYSVVYLFEAVANDTITNVATFEDLMCGLCTSSVGVADVDGDGKREILHGTENALSIYRNTGNDAWEQIWSGATPGSGPGSGFKWLGAGDHDGDGKAEVVIPISWIYEIDPADAADIDADNAADSVDNCLTVPNTDQADADADGQGNVCDNCVYGPNPDQGIAVFGQTIIAKTTGRFIWPMPAEGLYVRGDLVGVSRYTCDQFGLVPLGTTLVDMTQPESGAAFYYLLRPDCPEGSWQSNPGAEPARDDALP